MKCHGALNCLLLWVVISAFGLPFCPTTRGSLALSTGELREISMGCWLGEFHFAVKTSPVFIFNEIGDVQLRPCIHACLLCVVGGAVSPLLSGVHPLHVTVRAWPALVSPLSQGTPRTNALHARSQSLIKVLPTGGCRTLWGMCGVAGV